jgi:hypothetical protein
MNQPYQWAEVSFGWSPKFSQRNRDVLDKWSQTEIEWKPAEDKPGFWQMAFNTRCVVPLNLAEAIATAIGENSFTIHKLVTSGLDYFTSKPLPPELPQFNQRTRVVIPGNALMAIRQVKVLEDCCTNELQSRLDEGWCLLAVCPQAQRRPDYVIGLLPEPVSDALAQPFKNSALHKQPDREAAEDAVIGLPNFVPAPIEASETDDDIPF